MSFARRRVAAGYSPGSWQHDIPGDIRWGILATGKIAHTFADDLALVPDARLVAVGSRRLESAEAFAATTPAARPAAAHGSYEALVADPEVDVVYVASPHSPTSSTPGCASRPASTCSARSRWRSTPRSPRRWSASPASTTASSWRRCGRPATRWSARSRSGARPATSAGRAPARRARLPGRRRPDDRMLDPELGAGGVLDMGIYPLTLAHLLLGEAEELRATADALGPRGRPDIVVAGRYPGGALATMTSSMTSWSRAAAHGHRRRPDRPRRLPPPDARPPSPRSRPPRRGASARSSRATSP